MNKAEELEKQLNDEKFSRVYERIEHNHAETEILLKQILEQTRKTNGRVTKLEDETSFFRFFTKHPKVAALIVIGLIALLLSDDLAIIFKAF